MLKVQEIRELIKLIDESSIDEFKYETDGVTVSMKKTVENNVIQRSTEAVKSDNDNLTSLQTEPPQAVPVESPVTDKTSNQTTEASPQTVDYDSEIVSPMVGTFYASPTPESDPYLKVGSNVEANTIVCIVEAMKLFNEIEAETDGQIVEILADNGELVEYGQPLFRVKTQ